MSIVPEISAKTLLAPMKNGQWWFGGDYNMNLYRGCVMDVFTAIHAANATAMISLIQ